MSLGRTPDTKALLRSSEQLCAELVPPTSLYAVLFREWARLFPDEAFADLYGVRGRPSAPPRILALAAVTTRGTVTLIRSAMRQVPRRAER